ncbi:MAG: hypothetical protein QM487_05355 [Candidatus Marithrix sp.]
MLTNYRLGNRGDFGNTLVLLLPILSYYYNKNHINKFQLIFIVSCNVLSLYIMHGRTALISYVFVLILLILYKNKLQLRLNKHILILLTVLSFGLAFKIFLFRTGINFEQLGHEARYFSALIFADIIQNANIYNLWFGFGFGGIFDDFAENIQVATAHVNQIKESSGISHYVSWGFHNNIMRVFLLFGAVGASILYLWQISLFYIKRHDYIDKDIVALKTILKIMFLSTILLSFSNGIYGTTLVASILFTLQGVIAGEIKAKSRINGSVKISVYLSD